MFRRTASCVTCRERHRGYGEGAPRGRRGQVLRQKIRLELQGAGGFSSGVVLVVGGAVFCFASRPTL